MRGKVFMRIIDSDGEGITPAYAGKRIPCPRSRSCEQDHPRLCGEKSECRCPLDSRQGSPPPMRGKAHGCHLFPPLFWITPAYAGKSVYADFGRVRRGDHPRLCGEKIEERNPSDYVLGSPPPMRGKVYSFGNVKDQVGITPAYAGKRDSVA